MPHEGHEHGIIGNPFTNLLPDPSAQWPGLRGQYLDAIVLAVGAIDRATLPPPRQLRDRMAAGDPRQDRIYRADDGILQHLRTTITTSALRSVIPVSTNIPDGR
jgi:hypothetical protein